VAELQQDDVVAVAPELAELTRHGPGLGGLAVAAPSAAVLSLLWLWNRRLLGVLWSLHCRCCPSGSIGWLSCAPCWHHTIGSSCCAWRLWRGSLHVSAVGLPLPLVLLLWCRLSLRRWPLPHIHAAVVAASHDVLSVPAEAAHQQAGGTPAAILPILLFLCCLTSCGSCSNGGCPATAASSPTLLLGATAITPVFVQPLVLFTI
jgi:hypothetical protein